MYAIISCKYMQKTKHLPISQSQIHTRGQYKVTYPKMKVFVEGGWMTWRELPQAPQMTGTMLSTMPISESNKFKVKFLLATFILF